MKRPRWIGAIALVALATLFLFGSSSAPANAQEISIDDAHNALTVTGAEQGDSVVILGTLTNVSGNDYPSALTAVFFREVGGDIASDDMSLSWWAGAPGWLSAGPSFPTNYPGYQMEMNVGGSGFPLPPHFAGAGTWIKAVAERDFGTVEIKVITYVDATGNGRYDLNEAIISELAAVIDQDIQIDLMGDNLDTVYVDDDSAGCDTGDPASNVPVEEVASGKFCQINAFATIQEAIDTVTPGGTVDVYPGTYDQDEANDRDPVNGGAGSDDFNIFVDKALTIQGVNDSGTPITDYADVAAYVIPKRDTGGGHTDTIFVQADDVTITGLDVTGWTGVNYENQKTLESVGDNLTVKYNQLHGVDGAAALYLYDPRFDAEAGTSHVQSYLIEANLIDGGGIWPSGIRISSGAGWSGPVSERVIKDNDFEDNCDGIAFVGPQADPWDVYPVGAATITGNSFSRSDRRHVIAWGQYLGGPGYGDLDWQATVDNNTFDKAAITWTSLGDARPWDFAPQFYNVRGIYSAIQRYAINKAQNGDTIQVLPGLYPETLNIESFSDLSIVGDDRDTVIIKPTATLPWNVGGYGSARQAAVRVVSSTDVTLSTMTFDFDTIKGNNVAGVLYWDSTGAISGNMLKNMSLPDASGGYYELTSYVRAPTYSDGARAEVEFIGNEFLETGRLGIVTHDFVNATIEGNTFTKTTDDFGYAMEIGSRSTATVSGNTISGYDTPAASDGSTSAGIYVENSFTGPAMYPPSGLPHINKPVTISGNNVYGNQYGVWIGNEFDGYAGDIDVVVTMTGNNIHDNTDGGVYVVDEDREYGSSVTLNASGNTVSNNGETGYFFTAYGDGELHGSVSEDDISGQKDGIRIDNTSDVASFFDITVGPHNDIFDNDNGVIGFSVSGIVISGNEIHHNLNRSRDAGAGIDLWGDNDNNQILGNVIHDNDRQGIFVGYCDFAGPYGECTAAGTPISTGNTISGNTVYDNGLNTSPNPPDASAYGIQLWNADDNIIADNEVYGHDDWLPYPPPSTFDFAQGIYLIDSNNNTVTDNDLHSNNYGVGVWGPSRGDGSNLINNNTIAGNTGYGVRSFDSAFLVDATSNWWGHVTGPYHLTKNPAGLGDNVSDYVLFDPWLKPGDEDMDGVGDAVDNCPTTYNPGQTNSDGGRRPNGLQIPGDWASNPAQDKLGDACDPDDDNDALPDVLEFDASCPYRLVADSDGDAVMDGFEVATGYDPCNAANKPTWTGGSDGDGDGLLDGVERAGYNACAFAGDTVPGWATCVVPQDSDGDGCADTLEVLDLNGDRVVNSIDQLLIAKRAAGMFTGDLDSDKAFDVTKDGKVNSIDVLLVGKNQCSLKPGLLGCPKCPAE
ncbi:MAG TPA: right-handed parallel beta-helix repeat-containing protein [Dehalococcoidia bacterium]|nr:right-handed parallel beta-helix repeat-containing protein [Dehalococcoidia bacterium]